MKVHNVNSYPTLEQVSGSSGMHKDQKYRPYQLSGAQNDEVTEQKKKGFSWKKASNVGLTAAWIALVTYGLISTKKLFRNSPQQLKKKSEEITKMAKKAMDDIDAIKNPINMNLSTKVLYKISEFFNSWKNKLGEELYNNVLYAIGTLFVMPTVVYLSPSHKDKNQKVEQNDKSQSSPHTNGGRFCD